MTLHVDNQAGSKPLIKLLKRILPKGCVVSSRYPTGDVWWEGKDGKKYVVEVKHLNDVLKCIQDGRFVSQLRRMKEEFDECWLLIVDEFRASGTGELEFKKYFGRIAAHWFKPYPAGRNQVDYAAFVGWLTTMELPGGCHLWHVQNNEQAVHWLAAKYKWSQKKTEQHKSLKVFDTSRPAPKTGKAGVRFFGKPNEIACVANALVRGIGWEKAQALGRHFDSPEEFWQAGMDELMQVKGIGKELASQIVMSRKKKIR